MRNPKKTYLIMAGPFINSKGGISSVIKELQSFYNKQQIKSIVLTTTYQKASLYVFLKSIIELTFRCLFVRPEIVHLHIASRGSCLRKAVLATICILLRVPYIIHLHGGGFHSFYNNELNLLGKAFVRKIFKQSNRVIALSASWKDWLNETLKLINVTIVFNGTSPIDLPNKIEPPENPTILFMGNIVKQKGVDDLIIAFKEILKVRPNAILELAGDGDISAYKNATRDIPNIRFLGWINESQRLDALSRASVYCLPSYNEGLPMSILEAMSAGLPIISTNVGGIPEMVIPDINGYLVNPGSPKEIAENIMKIIQNPVIAKRLGNESKKLHSSLFSTETMGASFLKIYNEIKRS
jgi:glycosyltransferase involved in cell wall biosynthesis